MAKKQAFSASFVPDRFRSIEELHNLGFALKHERKAPALEQPWIQRAKQMQLTQAELARRCGLTRQNLSLAAAKKTKLDIVSALLICETLGISVEEGFRLSGEQHRYVPCRCYDKPLFVNLRTLEVVSNSEKQENESYEKLYYILNQKGV